MWTKLLFLCSLALSLRAQEDPRDLLGMVRGRLEDTIQRLPRYICTQTIERNQYGPAPLLSRRAQACGELVGRDAQSRPPLSFSDRLRLDVAVANTGEIYSWVGEDRFDNRDLFDLVKSGAVSTGAFASFLTSIFTGDAASFSYNGETNANGRTLAEFGFRVPFENSNYVFGNRRTHVTTAYDGTFLVDAKTFDLVRLTVRTGQLPAEVGACEAATALDYSRVRLNNTDFLLPKEVQLKIVNVDGSDSENRTTYANCHQFVGESTVTFGEPLPERALPAAGGTISQTLAIPPDLPFKLVFTQPIDAAIAAAGDRITAKIARAIRDASSKVLVPEGAAVTARIVKIQHYYGPPSSLKIAVKLETLDIGGSPRPFAASLTSFGSRFQKSAGFLSRRVELGSLDTLGDRTVGMFEFRDVKPNYVVGSGLESTWVTVTP
jgi:hypothetical protein